MASGLETDLRELVARRRILVIVGSGVSIYNPDETAASWEALWKD
jgi:hypothetical protein